MNGIDLGLGSRARNRLGSRVSVTRQVNYSTSRIAIHIISNSNRIRGRAIWD